MNKAILTLLLLISTLCIAAQDITTIPEDSISDEAVDTVYVDSISSDQFIPVQERISKLLEAKMFQTSQVGIMVYDLTADTLIYAHNEQQTMRPASTTKLTTAITALDYLGGSYRFATTMKYRGAIYDAALPGKDKKTNVLIGNIIAVGGMDPRFGSDDMNAFVEALQKENIDTIYGEVQADRSFKDSDLLGEGWCWDDDNPVLTPLLWNRKDNFVNKLTQCIRNAGIVIRPRSEIPRDSLGNQFYTTKKDTTAVLATRYHSIDQILNRMMKDSDNLYAESLLYQVAHAASKGKHPGRAKDALAVSKDIIRRIGLDPSDYRLADGSGLSLYNYQSAQLQVRLLRYAYANPNIYEHLYPSLPVAGIDGTLKKRMTSGKPRLNVHAKTGTVTGVVSLSGYVTAANGNMLCFAIINQGVLSNAPARNFQDRLCYILCDYGEK